MIKLKKKTIEEIRVFVEGNSECELLSEKYESAHKNLTFKCKCGEKFNASFSNFKGKDKRACNKCKRSKSQDYKKVDIAIVKEFVSINSDCELLSESIAHAKDKLVLKCSCGNNFERTWSNFVHNKNRFCPSCSKDRKSKNNLSYDYVKSYIEGHSDCKLLSDFYVNNSSKITLECGCGNQFSTTFNHFKTQNKHRCNKCSKKHKYTNDEVSNEIESSGCMLISDYENVKSPLKIKCGCGRQFHRSLDNFRKKLKQCAFCSKMFSKGSLSVLKFLDENSINYELEYTYKDLISDKGHLLRFDFAIIREDGRVSMLIEYDGEFHFKKIHEGHDIETQIYHDKLKDSYCKDNDISLLRIPYWEFDNIENILEKSL